MNGTPARHQRGSGATGAQEQQRQQEDKDPEHTPMPEAHFAPTAAHGRHDMPRTTRTRNTILRFFDDILPTSDTLRNVRTTAVQLAEQELTPQRFFQNQRPGRETIRSATSRCTRSSGANLAASAVPPLKLKGIPDVRRLLNDFLPSSALFHSFCF